jgi:hypothetical protein
MFNSRNPSASNEILSKITIFYCILTICSTFFLSGMFLINPNKIFFIYSKFNNLESGLWSIIMGTLEIYSKFSMVCTFIWVAWMLTTYFVFITKRLCSVR